MLPFEGMYLLVERGVGHYISKWVIPFALQVDDHIGLVAVQT